MPNKISDKVYDLCTKVPSISDELAHDPKLSPKDAIEKLFGGEKTRILERKPPKERVPATEEDLERARQCGRFGESNPSELFLRIFHDALCTLDHDSLMGCVSPALMGSTGVLPLTVIGPLADVARHMSNLIARAEKEVLLATNYWMDSDASKLITNGLRELSKRAGERGEKAVVKIIYDRGNIKQVVDQHHIDSVAEYIGKSIRIPSPEEIPNIDIQVQNYHRPALGTFHAKYVVVDRKIGLVMSNNIQDNDNLEMMSHVEGPIVDAFYDTFLVSWYKALEPHLPTHATPAADSASPTFEDPSFRTLFSNSNDFNGVSNGTKSPLQEHLHDDPHYDPDIASEVRRLRSVMSATHDETVVQRVTQHLNSTTHQSRKGDAPDCSVEDYMQPYIPHAPHSPIPMALVSRKPWGAINHQCVFTPQNEAWLSSIRNAKKNIFIQTPDLNAEPLIPEIAAAVKRGVEVTYYVCLGYNDAGELLPHQGGTNEMIANKLYTAMDLNDSDRELLHVYYYVAKDMTRPIHNGFKGRSCHIKLLIADEHIGIQGNGNQDTQSWYHSQELNLMIDSYEICGQWIRGLKTNQNTHIYGAASQEDGIWRDAEGKEAEGAIGKDPGRFAWATGILGAVNRVRGVGGF